MTLGARAILSRWSTDEVPVRHRFDYFADALSSAITPMQVVRGDSRHFSSAMTAIELPGVTVLRQVGTPHRSLRDAQDVAHSADRSYHLILNVAGAWTLEHRGRTVLRAGDAILIDSRYENDLQISTDYDVVHLKLTQGWVERWVKNPDALVGRRLPLDATWSAALTTFVACLSPEGLVASPVAETTVTDQVGALLALVAHEVRGDTPQRPDVALRRLIDDCIVQRCPERMITAADVAASLRVPEEVVHRTLAAIGETFADVLCTTRSRIAARMLASPLFAKVPATEIAHRVGFSDARRMACALRRLEGTTGSLSLRHLQRQRPG